MMKKLIFTLTLTGSLFTSCTELQTIASQLPTESGGGISGVSSTTISQGLKQALNFGGNEGIDRLGQKDGFFGNATTKILLDRKNTRLNSSHVKTSDAVVRWKKK